MANRSFDDETVRRIRAEAKHWPLRVLSKRHEATEKVISQIINRRTYAHVA